MTAITRQTNSTSSDWPLLSLRTGGVAGSSSLAGSLQQQQPPHLHSSPQQQVWWTGADCVPRVAILAGFAARAAVPAQLASKRHTTESWTGRLAHLMTLNNFGRSRHKVLAESKKLRTRLRANASIAVQSLPRSLRNSAATGLTGAFDLRIESASGVCTNRLLECRSRMSFGGT